MAVIVVAAALDVDMEVAAVGEGVKTRAPRPTGLNPRAALGDDSMAYLEGG